MDNEIRSPKREGERIAKYLNGDLICNDVAQEFIQLKKACLARAVKLEEVEEKPEKKTFFESPCPMWFKEDGASCTKDKVAWQCMNCFDQV